MTDFARLVLASDTTGLREARGELNQLTRTGDQTERKLNAATAKMSAGFRAAAAGAAALVASLASVGVAIRASQEITGITNGLRAMGLSTEQAQRALDDIAGIAERTRAPLRETAELYRRVSVASRDMGASQADVLRFTENVGLALGASGTSAQEASGALLQLSQAMAGGTVRAEEFNSILEGAFPIAQAAANGIDGAAGSVGRLRQMVVEGEVSSREFFEAIISQSVALQTAFDQTEVTIEQATTGLRDSFALLANETDQAFGISSGIASGIEFVADNLEILRAGVLGAAAVITGMYLPAIVSATGATAAWIASLITLRGALIATGIGALIVGAGVLIDFLIRLRSATGSWGEALSALGDLASGVWEGIKTSAQSIGPALAAVWEGVKASFFVLMESLSARWRDFLLMLSGFAGSIPGAEGISGDLAEAAAKADAGMTGFMRSANDAEAAATRLRGEASALATQGFDKAREAAARLMEIVNGEGEASDAAAEQAKKLAAALGEVSDGSGGAASKAAKGLTDAEKALRDLEKQSDQTADKFGDMVAGIVTGAGSIGDVFKQLGQQLLSSGISGIASSLFKGSGLSEIFAGFFDNGGRIGAGQFGIVGERGPEIVSGPANVTSRVDTARMMQGGGGRIEVVARVENGSIVQDVRRISGEVAVQVTQAGIKQFAREGLPVAVDRINRDPRRRG
ncbi:tape measure protein [Roseovarius mucosus]|uniref:tape measure protein n=1 Tax=Roseovarius mucosus TaxID=215743 RepID=UPI0035CEE492